jgi:hypothetical protein
MVSMTFKCGRWLLFSIALLGCARSGSSSKFATEAPQHPGPGRLASSRSLDELIISVEGLESRTNERPQRELARVLQSFGKAMEPLSHATNLRISEVAQRLAGAPAGSLSHAGMLKEALTLLSDSLVSIPQPPRRRDGYARALRASKDATEAIDDLQTLENQRSEMVAALHAAADLVSLARGGEAPFGEADRVEQPSAPLGSFETELERAADDVSRLAQANLTPARKAAASALAALGDVVAAADASSRLNEQVVEIRFEAERLARAKATEFGQAGWIRSGLEGTLDAFARLYPDHTSSVWLRNARRAVGSIDPGTSLSFQRATIQDAFRTTVDAFSAAGQSNVGGGPSRRQP